MVTGVSWLDTCTVKVSDSYVCYLHVAGYNFMLLTVYYMLHYFKKLIKAMSINNHQSLSLPTSIQFNQLPTKSHLLSLIPLTSSINCYRFSFFVNTIFLWNHIPYSILSLSRVPVFRRALYHYLCT